MDIGTVGSGARIRHMAACPDISPVDCSKEDIPEHWHDQRLMLGRFQIGWELGLGKGFQIQAILPVDLKGSRIEYTDMDGNEYMPPYAGIHHRNETLVGLGDARIMASQVRAVGKQGAPAIRLGTTLPLGRTEENPYVLGLQSKEHQHFQFGTGTFMPTANVSLFLRKDRWGLQAWTGGQVALYANAHGFKPGVSGNWGIAPQYRIHARVDLLLPIEGVHQARNRWGDNIAPSSGKHSLRTGVLIGVTVKRGLWLYTQASVPVWQQSLSTNTNDQILEPFLGTLGISWRSDKALWK